MPAAVYTSTTCLEHRTGPGHPERPERLATVLGRLGDAGIATTQAGPATRDALLLCHPDRHLALVESLDAAGGALDGDTPVGPGSWRAALGASGAALAALDHALAGKGPAFAAIRPPGHHALASRGMGFCLVNHVAIVAAMARSTGARRILVVDWDVHHGNGTQAIVEHDPDTRFVSMHQWPWYPGTGAPDERGVGNCFNIPLAAGLARQVYVDALWGGITAATAAWTPDIVLVSAGYDGMRGDPLGGFTLEPEDFATWVTRLRDAFPAAPLVALMEGGYAPERLAAGVIATVRAMA